MKRSVEEEGIEMVVESEGKKDWRGRILTVMAPKSIIFKRNFCGC